MVCTIAQLGARVAAPAGYPVRLRGAIRIGLPYHYVLREGATLADYNMEAQGELLADYWALKYLKKPDVMRQQRYCHSLSLYEAVLSHFLRDPGSPSNLPRGWGRWQAKPAPHTLVKDQ
jgi:hypothetical protein